MRLSGKITHLYIRESCAIIQLETLPWISLIIYYAEKDKDLIITTYNDQAEIISLCRAHELFFLTIASLLKRFRNFLQSLMQRS